jgi:hypothetical protein
MGALGRSVAGCASFCSTDVCSNHGTRIATLERMNVRTAVVIGVLSMLGIACGASEVEMETSAHDSHGSVKSDEAGSASRPTKDRTAARDVAEPSKWQALQGVAAIVEADVTRTWQDYDEQRGPRTCYALGNVRTHAGVEPDEDHFCQLGGDLPDGTTITVMETAEMQEGARYIFFFGEEATVYTSIWAGQLFRVESAGRKSIVLTPDAKAVLKLDETGAEVGAKRLLAQREGTEELMVKKAGPLLADALTSGDVAAAMDKEVFARAASELASRHSAVLGRRYRLKPVLQQDWRTSPTTPAAVKP